MSHRHKKKPHQRGLSKSRQWLQSQNREGRQQKNRGLEIVLKCDSAGTLEAVTSSIAHSGTRIDIIYSGVGDITMSDVLMAGTGSRLIIGYQVNVLADPLRRLKEQGVEIRLFDVIYNLTEDLRNIAGSLHPGPVDEKIFGSARVIALFKSCRRGIIMGCEIKSGYFALGQDYRIISAVGPVYSSKIESMHIEKNAVTRAGKGQQVGIKIRDFNKVQTGDIVESFQPLKQVKLQTWQPQGRVITH